MIADIAQLGAPVLRQPAASIIDANDLDTLQTIEIMHDTLAASDGVGIAAPQIHISKRIIIIASRPNKRYPNAPLMSPTVMLNPSFQPLSEQKDKDWEGCLSVPGIRALVPRYRSITIRYTDLSNQIQEKILEGFVARIFQHECDHLDGKVYLDRVENNGDIVAESEFYRLLASSPG